MDAVCPNCGGLLETKPTRKKKCPHCSRYIYVRQGRLIGEGQPISQVTQPQPLKAKKKTSPFAVMVGVLVALSLCCGILVIGGKSNQDATSNLRSAAVPTPTELPTLELRVTTYPKVSPTKPKPTNTPLSESTIKTSDASEFDSSWEAAQVIKAFQDAGLELVDPKQLTRSDFKKAPYVADEAMEFSTPSFCPKCRGRVFTFSSLEDLETLKTYLEQGSVPLFVKDNVLIEIYASPDQAKPYGTALNQMPNVTKLAAPVSLPYIEVEKDVNLRSGPGTNYEITGALSPGQSFNIIGRNPDSSWWQIAVDNEPAWVAASVVKATNIDQNIEIAEAPPPPPATATPTVVIPTPLPTPILLPTFTPAPFSPAPVSPGGGCCKICSASKACGDSCISANKTCHKPPGCACNG